MGNYTESSLNVAALNSFVMIAISKLNNAGDKMSPCLTPRID